MPIGSAFRALVALVRVLRAIVVTTNRRRLALLIGSWSYVACNADPIIPDATVQARLIVSWDAGVCEAEHDVVLELEDKAGAELRASVVCDTGSLEMEIQHWGVYRGRIYVRTPSGQVRPGAKLDVDVDAPVVHRTVPTPR
jgi:hypothetical protein